jgi:hypothetical protein
MTIQGGSGPKSPPKTLRTPPPQKQAAVVTETVAQAAPPEERADLFEESSGPLNSLGFAESGTVDSKDISDAISARRRERARASKHGQQKDMLQQSQARLLSEQQVLQARASELFHSLVEMDFAPEARESLRTEMDRVRDRMGKVKRRLGDIRRRLNAATASSSLGAELPARRASRRLLQERAQVGSVSNRGSVALALARQSRPRNANGSRATATWVDVSQARDKVALGSQLANWNIEASVSQQIAMQLGWPGGLQPQAPSCSNGNAVDDLTSIAAALASNAGSSAS